MSLQEEYNLFEYQNELELSEIFDQLKDLTHEIWTNRPKSGYFRQIEKKKDHQQYLKFNHEKKSIKAKNYVGVIRWREKTINLLPKIFYREGIDDTENKEYTKRIHQHIFWWLRYCRKFRFSKNQTDMSKDFSNIFEMMIYFFAQNTIELLSKSLYVQFEDIQRETTFIKGRLNIHEYISDNLVTAKWHKFNCTYDTCTIDNRFNRILKFVTKLLVSFTCENINKELLNKILFFLDEVSDEPAVAEDCHKIRFNPMYDEYEIVKNYCYLFLSNCISVHNENDFKAFAFLIPMEYLFEDFIYGFIDKEIEGVKATPQKDEIFLDKEKTFKLKPDLVLEINKKKYIADTKYKVIFNDEEDKKKGISQSDMYQMIAYAVRYGINEIFLFYPNTVKNSHHEENNCERAEFKVKDELSEHKEITIYANQLPIISHDIFDETEIRQTLKKHLETLFKSA